MVIQKLQLRKKHSKKIVVMMYYKDLYVQGEGNELN